MLSTLSLRRPYFSRLFILFLLIVCFAGTAIAQSALDGFDPNANGIVAVVVVQSDGKILIGGDFTIVKGISRNRIARLNPDGTLDQLFDPNSSGYVSTIAVQADGNILVGGSFNGANSIGGQARNRIARLDAITGQADSFDPNANNSVFSIAVQGDGQILAGGSFSSIGGQTRNHIARLDATTGLADSFNPAPTGVEIDVLVVQPDGKILVGGNFGSIGGQTRTHIARLDATTGLADSFAPNASPGFFVVTAIALQAHRRRRRSACSTWARRRRASSAQSPYRVALLASSGWSHAFLTAKNNFLYPDTPADRRMYEALRTATGRPGAAIRARRSRTAASRRS